ncbi:hypothetical protein P775_24515 [Puniceibacterium antarcticum]|uniref:ATPase BadF/BadG/BcrA/BcrD type domain-containing protein n=1 Tax=Puniceibacterium antarcticum TaxID=1206336 RepID=A0A2G8R756_9RHOB|nr:BadF/BadG/BcrA/BcrD ATPase family protein [Puniceibacterium antarcticum]PIL17369.1 hypothetical protein P775_24515 [Puniceibacterium antarcticum]
MTIAQPCLAVDGGGTHCRFALMWQGQRHEVQGSGANVTTDLARALEVLRAGFAALADRAGVGLNDFNAIPAYLGLAGVIDADTGARVAQALPFTSLRVDEDRPAALIGALGDAFGSIAAVGTGSFLGRADDDGVRFIGGHGLVLGDEASGAWLGRAALAASLRAQDGIGPDSAFLTDVRGRMGGVAGVITFARRADPAQFGALAPEVASAAASGDAVARDLMRQGAGYLAQGLQALGWAGGERLCLLGGLGPSYAPWLPAGMQSALSPPAGTALDGALRLAAQLAEAG